MVIVLTMLFVLCMLVVIYPYVIYPIVLRFIPTVEIEYTGLRPKSATLMFCAYNEGAALTEKLRNIEMLKQRYHQLEVLAYSDGSSDDTLERLRMRPDLLTVVDGGGRLGKAHGMKHLAGLATGEVLIFTDANVVVDDDAIDHLLDWYRDPNVSGVCGTLRYLNSQDSATASVGGAYWRLEEKLKSWESRTGNVMGADGSIFSLRREIYPEFPDTVLDDLTVSMTAVFEGRRLVKADNVIAYERLVSARGDEFARKVRIAARAFHTHLFLRPQLKQMSTLDKFKYTSRKTVRWFGGLFLLVGVALTLLIAFHYSLWGGSAALVLIAISIFAGARIQHGVVGQISEVVLALLATLLGVARAMRGQTVATWSPAKSR
ncbi:glycosyltransferase [Microbacterium esteraromaticum]|uniref:glycosyltransferase n=1 Tax=Microbacterium esteraromaticum TaxID=57043 RepID=UPI000B35B10A|nr:glycosyltransferase [Microbacterium esteraromaticum]